MASALTESLARALAQPLARAPANALTEPLALRAGSGLAGPIALLLADPSFLLLRGLDAIDAAGLTICLTICLANPLSAALILNAFLASGALPAEEAGASSAVAIAVAVAGLGRQGGSDQDCGGAGTQPFHCHVHERAFLLLPRRCAGYCVCSLGLHRSRRAGHIGM